MHMVDRTTVREKHAAKIAQREFETERDKRLERVPPEFHEALATMAWNEGHGNGYSEVLIWLDEYIDFLVKPIANYTRRIRREAKR